MKHSGIYRGGPRTIALIGTYLPRQCGIATFTSDLLKSLLSERPDSDCWAIAVNDIPSGYRYPPEVRFEIDQKSIADYRLAAEFLNANQVDVVCLQHEFGIFGGDQGSHILDLVGNLRMPIITTLHTILSEPTPRQKAIIKKLGAISDRLVVLSKRAIEMLESVYDISPSKVVYIPHGIPDVPFVDPNYYKDQFGVEGKKVILTFGLLSPDKGIEYLIEALAKIVKRFPDVVCIVLGVTHPNIRREQGESYRLSLQRRARELGIGDHLIFHNRFVELDELCEFLGAADVYVSPYLKKEQIVSGTLSYALGTGKAVVSTPYWYADEMLADNRGKLVDFRDSEAIADAVIELLDNETERHAIRKRAYLYCRDMVWKEVARKYLEVFSSVLAERESHPRVRFESHTLEDSPCEIPQIKLDHLLRLTDDVGILQHAKFTVPDRRHGYSTDDNARALMVAVLTQEIITDDRLLNDLACRYLSFLDYAFDESTRRFRNFLSYERRWLDQSGTDDCNSRALWALGKVIQVSRNENLTCAALGLFKKALPSAAEQRSPRANAFAIIGIDSYLRKFPGDTEARRCLEKLSQRIFEQHIQNASDDWPWLENILTYANGKIPQAMLVAGERLNDGRLIEAGLKALEWLVEIQTAPAGHFIPIGNMGWYERGKSRARFDQQPIEGLHMIEACKQAYAITHDKKWLDFAQTCLEWYLGRNDLNEPLYDYGSGGCRDGLGATGANLNQGAESTLAWLLSLLNVSTMLDVDVTSPVEQGEGVVSEVTKGHGKTDDSQ